MKKLLIVLAMVVILPFLTLAQSAGDYRTASTGSWSSVGTWQIYNGSSWVPAVTAPVSSDGVVTILSPHTVTVNSVVSTDQVIVNSGGTLNITNGTFQLADGAGVDLLVNGSMTFSGSFIEDAGQIDVASGGSFTWTNGNMRGSGTTNFLAGSTSYS